MSARSALAVDFFLLTHDPFNGGRLRISPELLGRGLVGAELADLVLARRLAVDADARVVVADRHGQPDDLHDYTMRTIIEERSAFRVSSWVTALQDGLRALVERRLVASGTVRCATGPPRKVRGSRRHHRFPSEDLLAAAGPQQQLERLLRTPQDLTLQAGTLAALIHVLGAENLLAGIGRTYTRELLIEIVDHLPRDLRSLLDEIEHWPPLPRQRARTSRTATAHRRRPLKRLPESLFLLEGQVHERERGGHARAALEARNAVGVAHWDASRYEEAAQVFEAVVTGSEDVWGEEHGNTLVARGNLGMAYVWLDRWDEGLALLADNVMDRARVFGDAAPSTLTARHAQAVAHQLAGRISEALSMLSVVAEQRCRVLGPAHLDTLTSRVALALAHVESGDVGTAVPLLTAALDDAERSAEAPGVATIRIREQLALCHAELGELDRAVHIIDIAVRDGTSTPEPGDPLVAALCDAATELRRALARRHPDRAAVRAPRSRTTLDRSKRTTTR